MFNLLNCQRKIHAFEQNISICQLANEMYERMHYFNDQEVRGSTSLYQKKKKKNLRILGARFACYSNTEERDLSLVDKNHLFPPDWKIANCDGGCFRSTKILLSWSKVVSPV